MSGMHPAVSAALGAALHNPDAAEVVLSTVTDDLHDPQALAILQAMRAVHGRGAPVDPVTVAAELESAGASNGAIDVLDTMASVPSVAAARHYATHIAEVQARRRLRTRLGELTARLDADDDLDAIRRDALAALDVPPVGDPQPDPDVDAFLDADEPEHDWIVPGLVERGDRIVLTGPEGGGKSTLLRQVAVQTAAGLHPFTGEPIDPIRVLIIDLENSTRHVRRKLRPLRIQAGDHLDPTRLRIHVRPAGVDLLDSDDTRWLEQRITANTPDLLIAGPLYKMAMGDPIDEQTARHVAYVLDDLRTRHGFALILEAHQPYGSSGRRPDRPYGASLWSRWPEFGIHLAETGALRHWRGDRDERTWPNLLARGGHWPWTVPVSADDERWARILAAADQHLTRPSFRQLADTTGIAIGTLHRTVDAHRDEWDALYDDGDER